ncbi:MAG: KTSC domain-containing protein [Oceanospirillaceae bacterium]|nr:KTSC domain-containing protein [Oceanospirillaceae bacterium]MCP5349868.1 KTSC domain-containing protein [Oceanospirillaceae bacterium]
MLTDRQQVEAFLRDINEYYTLSIDDADQQEANAGVRSLLDTCSRVIVITHSQGNFYGNRVLSNLYSSYSFPNGYSLSRHPMLGNLQIASPVDIPGGAISAIYPEIIGHLTNDNDLIMALVRGTMGSTDSNYAAEFNPNDWTGHGLEESYLNRAGQGAEISSQLAYIASNLTPYPMHEQRLVVSSALSGYGHSSINNLLDIKFLDGSVYRYSDVSAGTAAGLDSGAAGSYFNSSIRGKYLYEKIE